MDLEFGSENCFESLEEAYGFIREFEEKTDSKFVCLKKRLYGKYVGKVGIMDRVVNAVCARYNSVV